MAVPAGQVVVLKSGGPKMTTFGSPPWIGPNGTMVGGGPGPGGAGGPAAHYVRCVWFVGEERREGDFHESSLTAPPAPAPPAGGPPGPT